MMIRITMMYKDNDDGNTHIWMFFDRYIDFFRMNYRRAAALRENKWLLHVAVDLEEVASDFADL